MSPIRTSRQRAAGALRRRPSREARRFGPRAVLLAGIALLATGCTSNAFTRMGMLPPVTKEGGLTLHLWQGSWVAAWIVGIIVWFLIIYSVVFHRKRAGSDGLPDQVRYNLPIEVMYTVLPFIMVGVLFYFTARDENRIDAIRKGKDIVTVNVTGFQWSWQFQYPQYKVSSDQAYPYLTEVGNQWNPNLPSSQQNLPLLVIPTDRTVQFNLVSNDVDHSFWIPQFEFKRDLIPGHPNHFQVIPNKTGSFIGHCSELCGLYHSRMLFRVRIVTWPEFQQWASSQQARQATIGGAL